MQRGLGIFAIFAVLVAGARYTTSPSPSKTSETSAPAPPQPVAGPVLSADTSCPEFSEGAKGKSPGEIATLIDRYRDITPGTAPAKWQLPTTTNILLITVPDPLHTHLNLQFDRTMDALEEGAQDEDYTYNSSWLPWIARMPEFSGLKDQEDEEKAIQRRELCPGMILFRQRDAEHLSALEKSGVSKNQDGAYDSGLLVLVVAEKPTTGINRIQWDNALTWIQSHVARNADHTLRVLGPTFSGSVPSMVRALRDLENKRAQNKFFSSVLLYTGTMRGCTSFRLLQKETMALQPVSVHPADFVENDAVLIDRYFAFLHARGHHPSEVAILSEDQTAYGGRPPGSAVAADDPSCEQDYGRDGPLYLYYPRDISAVRSAYQEQSIFASPSTSTTSSAHIVLAPQTSESTHLDTDTIPTFSGANSALAEEAGLYGVVDSLKAHSVRFVILRSTSTLDYLFLTRFLHRAYPEAFIVTVGPDILYGRDVDSTEFRGVAALSAFPLLPRGQDWTFENDTGFRHAHRIFGADSMEGIYLAARYLMPIPNAGAGINPFPWKPTLPDYDPPFWDKEQQEAEQKAGKREPVAWLSVVGRDGYWPVAVLSAYPGGSKIASNLQPVDRAPGKPHASVQSWLKFSLSPAWKLACGLMLLGVTMHLLASCCLWRRQTLSIFVQFTPLVSARQLLLVGTGWGIVFAAASLMYLCSAPLRPYLQSGNVWWIQILFFSSALSFIGSVWDMGWRSFKGTAPLAHRLPRLLWLLAPLALFRAAFLMSRTIFSDLPTAYRAVHLTSGVSPIVSLLLLLGGFYWWFWQELSGAALLGPGKPTLPDGKNLDKALPRISSVMAGQIEAYATPLPLLPWGWSFYVFPAIVLWLLDHALLHPFGGDFDSMLHSFESTDFNHALHRLLTWAVYLVIFECTQLLTTWLSLKRLLLALNRLPLRRTFCALQGLSMHSLWSLSGTTSRSRYTIFSHQLESLFHLRNVLKSPDGQKDGNQALRRQVEETCNAGRKFVVDRANNADFAMDNSPNACGMRKQMSQCSESIFQNLLFDDWCEETNTLDLAEQEKKDEEREMLPLSHKETIRRAEEFICLIYVGYLQNLLARMRTMVLAILGLYAAVAFSLAFYPYTPRPAIALTLLLLLVAIGSVVALVYAGLDRDTTMSHITNTKPGTLGLDFWVRLGSFIGVPIVGLLVAQFPEIGDFIASWIQPSLSAVK